MYHLTRSNDLSVRRIKKVHQQHEPKNLNRFHTLVASGRIKETQLNENDPGNLKIKGDNNDIFFASFRSSSVTSAVTLTIADSLIGSHDLVGGPATLSTNATSVLKSVLYF